MKSNMLFLFIFLMLHGLCFAFSHSLLETKCEGFVCVPKIFYPIIGSINKKYIQPDSVNDDPNESFYYVQNFSGKKWQVPIEIIERSKTLQNQCKDSVWGPINVGVLQPKNLYALEAYLDGNRSLSDNQVLLAAKAAQYLDIFDDTKEPDTLYTELAKDLKKRFSLRELRRHGELWDMVHDTKIDCVRSVATLIKENPDFIKDSLKNSMFSLFSLYWKNLESLYGLDYVKQYEQAFLIDHIAFSHNRLTFVDGATITDCFPNVKYLHLDDNSIERLDVKDIQYLKNCSIWLEKNSIKKLIVFC